MNIPARHSRQQALTKIDVLALLAAVVLLAAIALISPMFAKGRSRSGPPCVSNLKMVGLAARMWSNDHNNRFPWMVSTNENGTKEFQSSPEVFRHFVIMSNELSSPVVLRCPVDTARARARSFNAVERVANKNISYFIGLEADERFTARILSGDRNLIGGITNGVVLSYDTNSTPGWGTNIHHLQGNLTFSDGSVQQLTSESLARQVQATFTTMMSGEMRLAIPRVPRD